MYSKAIKQSSERLIRNKYKQKAVINGLPFNAYSQRIQTELQQIVPRVMNLYTDLDSLDKNEAINLPEGRKQQVSFFNRVTQHYLEQTNEPIKFYAGSCPDYSHNGTTYTHDSLGSGVPLLTELHIQAFEPFGETLLQHEISFEVQILIADIEADDEIFTDRYTNGSREKFRNRCYQSMESTSQKIKQRGEKRIHSSSFFQTFGEQNFKEQQAYYQKQLQIKCHEPNFSDRLEKEIRLRNSLYKQMYPQQYKSLGTMALREFLIGRTIRTMAQYLTLAELYREHNGIPINHKTVNSGLYNEQALLRNPNSLPLPVFILNKKVY